MAQWVQLQSGYIVNIDQMHDIGIDERDGIYTIAIFRNSDVDMETPVKYIVAKYDNKVTATRNFSKLVKNIENGKKVVYFNYEK